MIKRTLCGIREISGKTHYNIFLFIIFFLLSLLPLYAMSIAEQKHGREQLVIISGEIARHDTCMERCRIHDAQTIVFVTLCAVLCGLHQLRRDCRVWSLQEEPDGRIPRSPVLDAFPLTSRASTASGWKCYSAAGRIRQQGRLC